MKFLLSRALSKRSDSELVELHDIWVGGTPPPGRRALVRVLRQRMQESSAADSIRASLEENAECVLGILLHGARNGGLTFTRVHEAAARAGFKPGAVRSALAALSRVGFAVPSGLDGTPGEEAETGWKVPHEVGKALLRAAADRPGPAELLTLRGHLLRHFRQRGQEPGEIARRMYRMLATEKALCGRMDALAGEDRRVVETAIGRFGGILSATALEDLGLGPWNALRLRTLLEESSLGTVGELDLEWFGIRQRGPVLAVFNEAVLAWLQREAGRRPVNPHSVASIGVDFVSNFSRFAAFVGDQNVRFTVRGTIFKSTGKRITESLIPNPGREFRRREILENLYRFSLAFRLIDRTGERSFRLTEDGQGFLGLPLPEKQRRILDWMVEDRTLPGDLRHQLRLRRTTLRYLKRLEPGVWYDAMFLPFVARNHYLAQLGLEGARAREAASFPIRSSADLRSLAWNLFHWIRKDLYLLGMLDMGYDEAGRACAIRLTPLGAELLGMIPGRELEGAGHLVVNPDFEVVLFPEEHSHTLVYELDRFCERELTDSLYHYRITPDSLQRALSQEVGLDAILDLLNRRSRTPLPQNVVYSLESWAQNGGMVTLDAEGCLQCSRPELLDRLEKHPGIAPLVLAREKPGTLRLRQPLPDGKVAEWVRGFGLVFRQVG